MEVLNGAHNRASFSCGEDALDRYLKQSAGQDMRRKVAVVYVLVDTARSGTIAGYYTLSASSVPLDNFPDDVAKRLPKYPRVPVALLGRLAVDTRYQGRDCGSRLVVDALLRSCTTSQQVMGIYAVVVEAKNGAVAPFHERFGFTRFADCDPPRLFLPVETAEKAVRTLLVSDPPQRA